MNAPSSSLFDDCLPLRDHGATCKGNPRRDAPSPRLSARRPRAVAFGLRRPLRLSVGDDSLRLLLVNHPEDEAVRVLRHLRRAGRPVFSRRVGSAEALRETLEKPWDAILCGDAGGALDARTALEIVGEAGCDVPLLVLAGSLGEADAVNCMRLGVRDVVLVGHLGRLLPALDREIAAAKGRARVARSEALLQQSERLRAVGEMTAGVAHDLRNLLNPIHLYVQLAQRGCGSETVGVVETALADISRLVKRSVLTVERLRDYARPVGTAASQPLDLNALVSEACDIARPRIAAHGVPGLIVAQLGVHASPTGSSGEVLGAIVNLLFNAIDAMQTAGVVTVRTGATADGAFVSIADDGPGMPSDVAARAFEPFFTTKGAGGTGLGLASVRRCMALHGGGVALETAPGLGTRFTLSFPSTVPAALPRRGPRVEAA